MIVNSVKSTMLLSAFITLPLLLTGCGSDSNKSVVKKKPAPTNTATKPVTPPVSKSALAALFPKTTEVFGVRILATADTGDDKVLHAANVLAQYLDNNEDGIADNPAVAEKLVSAKATLMMPATQQAMERLQGKLEALPAGTISQSAMQDLYASEVHPGGQGGFDASLEEVLHLITHVGYAAVYPGVFGEQTGSSIADAMDAARGGRFLTIPASYPASAWYTYDDQSCNYSCMVTEYTYWALTSLLGAQKDRLNEIGHEWKLNTAAKLRNKDAAVVRILSDQQYGLASKIPDGKYRKKQFVVSATK